MATAPGKFFVAAKQLRMAPHITMQEPEYFPSGKRCSNRLVGYSHARYPDLISAKASHHRYSNWGILTKIEKTAEPGVLISN